MKIHRTSIWDIRGGEVFLHHSAKAILPMDKICNRIVNTFTLTCDAQQVKIAVFPSAQPDPVALIPIDAPRWTEDAIREGFDRAGKLKAEYVEA